MNLPIPKKINKNIIILPNIILWIYQILSLISLFKYNDLSNVNYIKNNYTNIFIFISIFLYSFGSLACYSLYIKNKFLKVIRISSQIEMSKFIKRINFSIIFCYPIYLLISLSIGNFREIINSSYISLISIPLNIVVTKFPLILVYLKNKSGKLNLFLWIFYYLTISVVSGSKISLVYILFVLIIAKSYRTLIFAIPIIISSIGLFILGSENIDLKNIGELIEIFIGAFINRFDSLRAFAIIDQKDPIFYSITNIGDVITSLLPSCSAKLGCLNLTGLFSENILRNDIDFGIYEINIASEALLILPEIFSVIYIFLAGFLVQYLILFIELKFKNNETIFSVSTICFFLANSALWSAGLLATRGFIFLMLEILCLLIIIFSLSRKIYL